MPSDDEQKPIIENKSSMEILSELFGTFDADPPVIVKSEKEQKKHKKKKHKHKEKKHKKKSKKRKRSSCESSDTSDNSAIDLSDILIKTEKTDKSFLSETLQTIINIESIIKKEEEEEKPVGEDKKSSHRKRKHKHLEEEDESRHKSRKSNGESRKDETRHERKKRGHDDYKSIDLRNKIDNKHRTDRHREDYRLRDNYRYKEDHRKESSHTSRDNPFYRDRSEERRYKWFIHDKYRRKEGEKDKFRDDSDKIDKKKLLEIARRNAIQMMKSGSLPGALTLGPQAQEKVIAAIRSGGKTVEELTDFCKTLSKKEELGELSSVSEDSDSEGDQPFHHPFQIKDKPLTINIKNSIPLPIKSNQERASELRIQFPVSSGQQHRKTESEWVPVSPKKVDPPPPPPPPPPKPVPPPVTITIPITVPTVQAPVNAPPGPQVFPVPIDDKKQENIDIAAIVSQRLTAIRKLQENPNDIIAMSQMHMAQKGMNTWAESKQQIGQFTGSTGAQILTQAELSSGYQAWARKVWMLYPISRRPFQEMDSPAKSHAIGIFVRVLCSEEGSWWSRTRVYSPFRAADQLQTAAPVSGGMGMHLLQKMGWKPGEGLGKEKTGTLEPLLLEVKLDKKGIVAKEEQKKKASKIQKQTAKTLQGKHPVSLLGEYATKRKLGAPQYIVDFECGPDHKKNFLFKVVLNGIEYKPNIASGSKKEAKANAASICLQHLGLLPP